MENRRQGRPTTDLPWYALGAIALLVLLWTCRRAPLGVPAADDYDYLYALRFQPFDLFGPMGSLSYWRPLGRQIYYAALSPVFFTAPWIVTLVHACLLFALFAVLLRIARRTLPAPVAACVAAFPLLTEPMRTLLVWPTGGEYLMAMLASALAIHEALSSRWWIASLAALAALLCHEASVLVLPAMLLIAWRKRETVRGAAGVGVVSAVWLAGRVIARSHGAAWLDRGTTSGSPFLKWLEAVFRVLMSQLNLEELGKAHVLVAAGYALIALVALVLLARERRRKEMNRARPALLGAALWLVVGALPLAFLAQWNSWRSPFPALWLGWIVVGLPGLARPWLGVAALALRTLALVLAPTATVLIAQDPPPSASGMSFVRVARLQRTAEVVHDALLAAHPRLARGATIAYWSRPAVAEIAIIPPKAPRVWYGDSTLTWQWLWRPHGLDRRNDVVFSFENQEPQVVVIEPRTLDLARRTLATIDQGEARLADSLAVATLQAQAAHPSGQLILWVMRTRAVIAFRAGALEQAERLNQATFDMIGPTADYYAMAALIALARGDRASAAALIERGRALNAADPLLHRATERLEAAGR